MGRIEGLRVLVTGGGSGIGCALAARLTPEGARAFGKKSSLLLAGVFFSRM
jgi:NAD(P)-dependent dehydrogenase (short-subunit alcohol dehydrogenase family)